jgi:hypothetical protein
VDFSLDTFTKYKDLWLLWRALGKETELGSFEAPVSFKEAMDLPKELVSFCLEMDGFFLQMKKHRAAKSKAPTGPGGKQ